MNNILTLPARNLNTGSQPPGQTLTILYSIDKKVVCQANYHLTADAKYIQLPLPVLHRLMMGAMK